MMQLTQQQRLGYRQLGFSDLDIALGDSLLRHHGEHSHREALAHSGMLLSAALRAGHSALQPTALPLDELLEARPSSAADRELLARIATAPQTLVENNAVVAPIVYEHGHLYLSRYRNYEAELAADLAQRLGQHGTPIDAKVIAKVSELFDPPAPGRSAWQAIAALSALRHRFAVVSGGPGTGKTYTVVRMLAALLSLHQSLRVAVAAPTGKAAARLKESMNAGVGGLNVSEALRESLYGIAASTLHRLLGYRPGRIDFRHDRSNPLPLDVLIIDEASMVDLPLLAKTVRALPPEARLILVGDRFQLASVENGDVLASICALGASNALSAAWRDQLGELLADDAASPAEALLGDAVITLQHSRRFDPNSGIAQLAEAVNAGDTQALQTALHNDDGSIIVRPGKDRRALKQLLREHAENLAQAMNKAPDLTQLHRRQLLTPLRRGERGVDSLNAVLESRLRPDGSQAQWYAGRPVMITRNDYRHGLYNGDVGLTLRDERGLGVYFEQPGAQPLRFLPATLPAHETALAMTVHKSQGSEFEHVVLVLPEQDHPLLTRELLYTAISRARHTIEIWGEQAILANAIARSGQRQSGLRERLASLI